MKARYCIENVFPACELEAFRGGSASLLREYAADVVESTAERARNAGDLTGDVLLRVELRPADAGGPSLLDRIEAACGLPDPAEACRTVLALCREARR